MPMTRKVGRPKLPKAQKKAHTLKVQATGSQAKELKDKAFKSGQSVSTYLREKGLAS